ncbi:hypothetical protein ACTHGU_17605 [Chitinophagaceae bacterium MMS25-I14]
MENSIINTVIAVLDNAVTSTDNTFDTTPQVVSDDDVTKSVVETENEDIEDDDDGGGKGSTKAPAKKAPPRFKIELYNDQDELVKEKDALYISTEPAMPYMLASVVLPGDFGFSPLYAKLEIEYKKTITDNNGGTHLRRTYFSGQGIVKQQPEMLNFRNGNSDAKPYEKPFRRNYEFNFGDQLYGGNATISVYDDAKMSKPVATFKFVIKGENPTRETIDAYIDLKKYGTTYWFFKALITDESSYLQFDSKGMPHFGIPDGWGLTQRDQQYDDNIDLSYLWDWKKNIDTGVTTILEKATYVAGIMSKWFTADFIKTFNDHPENIEIPDDITYNNIIFSHIPTSIAGFDQVNPYFGTADSNKRSFLEANLIRSYNGGLFYKLEGGKGKYSWVIYPENAKKRNYVSAICSNV